MKKLMLMLMALLILATPVTSVSARTTSRSSFSSPSRSYSAPRTYSAPRVTTPAPKPVVTPKPAPKPVTQAPAPKTTKPAPTPKKTPEKPKYKGELKESNRYRNTAGQTVVYQERGISPWMFWLGFGFLWYNQDNDKCYDEKHNLIECKEKEWTTQLQ